MPTIYPDLGINLIKNKTFALAQLNSYYLSTMVKSYFFLLVFSR